MPPGHVIFAIFPAIYQLQVIEYIIYLIPNLLFFFREYSVDSFFFVEGKVVIP